MQMTVQALIEWLRLMPLMPEGTRIEKRDESTYVVHHGDGEHTVITLLDAV